MEIVKSAVDLFVHLDRHLDGIFQDYGTLTYLILFAIVFCETGLVVTPFLPGDSLLFAAGAIAGRGSLSIVVLYLVLLSAALLGDNTNYWIGRLVGPRLFRGETARFLNKKHLDRTHAFFEKYGGKTIIIARFVPIVRTFAPFVAGLGAMTYRRFVLFCIAGNLLWVSVCALSGYFFGGLEFVKRNFSLVVLAIIFISVLPVIIEMVRHRREARANPVAVPEEN